MDTQNSEIDYKRIVIWQMNHPHCSISFNEEAGCSINDFLGGKHRYFRCYKDLFDWVVKNEETGEW